MTESSETVVPLEKVGHSPSYASIIPLKDGRLLWAWGTGSAKATHPLYGTISSDGGRTWGDPSPLKLQTGGELTGLFHVNLVRLPSGALGLLQTRTQRADPPFRESAAASFHLSEDEGETWSEGVRINPQGFTSYLCNDRALVLSDGRVLLPAYAGVGPKPTSPNPKLIRRFGADFSNSSAGGIGYSFAYYSDDEGETWHRSRNEALVLLDRGTKGAYGMGEPAVVELRDGRLMMLGRTGLGRHFRSCSEDRGETWLEPEPTPLVCPPAPCSLQRIPETGDLLVIWNQVSSWEIMIGLYRHRLSCAISKDEGETWQNHKNLESLDDAACLEPSPVESLVLGKPRQPVDRERYHRAPGPLRHSYPTCTFLQGKAVISYGRSVLGDPQVITKTYGMDFDALVKRLGFRPVEGSSKTLGNNVVRVLPIEWLYS